MMSISGNTMAVADLDDRDFRELVKADCFKREADELSLELRNDENIERFMTCLQVLVGELNNQLLIYKENLEIGVGEPDEDWRLRTSRLKRAVETRLVEVKALVREMRRRTNSRVPVGGSEERRELMTQIRKLRYAIHSHRDTVLSDDYEPTEADLALWAEVETGGEG